MTGDIQFQELSDRLCRQLELRVRIGKADGGAFWAAHFHSDYADWPLKIEGRRASPFL